MAAEYDDQGNYKYPEGFDSDTNEWLDGFEKQREEWEAQYAAAHERWEAHRKLPPRCSPAHPLRGGGPSASGRRPQ
jgi:small subunit ribosomal protein S1